jgi:hypothetical protein
VYAEVTDGLGTIEMNLRIVDSAAIASDDQGVVFAPKGLKVNLTSPLAVAQLVFVIDAMLPRAGQYHCELTANDQVLMARRLLVKDPNPQSSPEEE